MGLEKERKWQQHFEQQQFSVKPFPNMQAHGKEETLTQDIDLETLESPWWLKPTKMKWDG